MKTVVSNRMVPRLGPADSSSHYRQRPPAANPGGRGALGGVLKCATLGALLLVATQPSSRAQQYSINWQKIAGGGGESQGGGYSLRGTIGQWDASRSEGGGFTLLGGFWGAALAGAFTPGNLVVQGVGEGLPGLANYAQLAWIQELTTDGVLAHALNMPTNYPRPIAAPFNLMEEGAQYTDGYLTRSADGQLVCVPGYNATNHEPSISGSSTSTVLRVIGVLDSNGALDTSRAAGMFSLLNFYSVASKDGSGFWAVGEAAPGTLSGLVYYQPGVATNSLTNALFRCVKVFNNQLYVSPQPGGGLAGGVYAVGSGLPSSGNPHLTQVFPLTGSPYQFEFNPAMTMAYVADDGLGNNGGIKKYTYNGTAWVSNYTLTISGTGTSGARGLVVDWSGANPILYATTAESSTANRLVRIADTGPGSPTVTVRTAPAYTAYRGVTWTPVRLVVPTIISERMLGAGAFELTFIGTVSQTYRVLAGSDLAAPLATWATVATGVFGTGPATYTDLAAANQPARFYRIASP